MFFAVLSVCAAQKECPVGAKLGTQKYDFDTTGKKGPYNWGKIKGFKDCNGKKQSPINLSTRRPFRSYSRLGPKPNVFKRASMKFYPSVYNWGMACSGTGTCGTTKWRGVTYDILQIHMHTPAEHTIDGKLYPLESHIVHANKNRTQFLVLGTVYDYADDEGAKPWQKEKPNWGIQSMLKGAANPNKNVIVQLKSLAKPFKGTCSYFGSLTTPPCTEAVRFFIGISPEKVTRKQVSDYAVISGSGLLGNSRPLMPLNGRNVVCYA